LKKSGRLQIAEAQGFYSIDDQLPRRFICHCRIFDDISGYGNRISFHVRRTEDAVVALTDEGNNIRP